jgi:hypothetical protein
MRRKMGNIKDVKKKKNQTKSEMEILVARLSSRQINTEERLQ